MPPIPRNWEGIGYALFCLEPKSTVIFAEEFVDSCVLCELEDVAPEDVVRGKEAEPAVSPIVVEATADVVS